MSFPALIVVPVSDMEQATATYKAVLGIDPYYESPYYTGFRTETGELGLDPNARTSGVLPYWQVDDLEGAIAALTAVGATVVKEPSDVGGGMTVAVLADTDGNPIGLRHPSA